MSRQNDRISRSLEAGIALARHLSAIHIRGEVHGALRFPDIFSGQPPDLGKDLPPSFSPAAARTAESLRSKDIPAGDLTYMSPEQAAETGSPIDVRSDLYALGVILYECLTGSPPFLSDHPLKIIHGHMAVVPEAPCAVDPGIPVPISDIVMKLLEKQPKDRYQSAGGIGTDLENCLSQWKASAKIKPFTPACRDVPHTLEISQRLYGRNIELADLKKSYEKAFEDRSVLIALTGPAGVGKTFLVETFYRDLALWPGYAVSGKFDQHCRETPYGAVMDVLNQLVDRVLAEPEDELDQWRTEMINALAPNCGVISDMVPGLERITGVQAPPTVLAPKEAQNRFNLVFQNFIRLFCRPGRPLTLFLDDLQWADHASLKLFEHLLTGDTTSHLLVIWAFREDETGPDHAVTHTIRVLTESGCSMDRISLGGLEKEALTGLLADTLHQAPASVSPLSERLLEKTGGNPYFANQFLISLYDDRFLYFDAPAHTWQWDLGKIDACQVSDNVAGLLRDRLQKIDPLILTVLKSAACMGSRFDLSTLALVLEQPPAQVETCLEMAAGQGVVMDVDPEPQFPDYSNKGQAGALHREYRFAHDTVRQAVMTSVSGAGRRSIHWQIGKTMLDNLPDKEKGLRLFDMVHHLNQGAAEKERHPMARILARLNLDAAGKARDSAAFHAARTYLKTGISFLGSHGFDVDYGLALALYSQVCEAAFLCGDFDGADQSAQVVLAGAARPHDKIHVFQVMMQTAIARSDHDRAIAICRESLQLCHVSFPRNPGRGRLMYELCLTRMALAGKSVEYLASLPPMENPDQQTVMKLLLKAILAFFYTAPEMLVLSTLKQVRMSLQNGMAPESAVAFGVYGRILSGMGEFDAGYRFGKLAISIGERFKSKAMTGYARHIFTTFLVHWKAHPKAHIERLARVKEELINSGHLELGANAGLIRCAHLFYIGHGLRSLAPQVDECMQMLDQFKHRQILNGGELLQKTLGYLTGKNTVPLEVVVQSGGYFKEVDQQYRHGERDDPSMLFLEYLFRLMLAYLFDQPGKALEYADQTEAYIHQKTAMLCVPLYYLFDCLARLSLYPASSPADQKKILKKTAGRRKKMKQWVRHAPMNFQHKLHLMAAETCRVLGRHNKAGDLYDRAVKGARDNGYRHEEALANELAAKFYLDQGKKTMARGYMQAARTAYDHWGATAKVRHLASAWSGLFGDDAGFPGSEPEKQAGIHKKRGLPEADLLSIIKAAKAVGYETDPTRLLEGLMAVVIENAGARKGFLILRKGGQLSVDAGVSTGKTDFRELPVPIEAYGGLCRAVVYYVDRTGRDVALDNAVGAGRFKSEPWIRQHKVKSLLCMPVKDREKIMGIFYLENRQMAGVFTQGRIEILKTVSEILSHALAKKAAEHKTALYQDRLRTLSSQLLLTEERERRRIAVDLHDRIGHALAGISMKLGELRGTASRTGEEGERCLGLIDDIGDLTSRSIEDTRHLTFEISPPILYDLGLEAALEWLAARTSDKYAVAVQFRADCGADALDEAVNILLFQSVRELLFNTVKHARASRADVSMTCHQNRIHVSVQDNGIGFDPDAIKSNGRISQGFGLFSIQERFAQQGGEVLIDASPGKGTCITLVVPQKTNIGPGHILGHTNFP